MTALLASLALALAGGGHRVGAYRHGDTVSVLKRSQYKGYRTEWSELLGRDAPRFGVDRTVQLNPTNTAQVYDTNEEFKIEFAFDHDRLLTSWITFFDGRGNYLNYIEFDFVFSGDHIRSVRWVTDYHEDGREKPDKVFLRYHWHEFVETDAASGLDFLMIVGTVLAWASAVLAVFGLDRFKKAAAKSA